MNTMKTLARTTLILALTLVPTLTFAASSLIVGSSGSSGYVGVQGGNSAFGFSWGSGGGGLANCASSICGVASTIIYLINSVLVPLLFAVAFIMFLYGVAQAYIFSHGDEGKVEEGHKLVLWGVIGFVIMISLWGLVNVVAVTFGLAGVGAPPTPTSY